jgi:hypothetical protein
MRAERARAATLALAALLACCHSEPPPLPPPSAPVAAAPGCHVGPDGAAVTADRGIGGTGSPILTADRGIGGTGEPTKGTTLADRGIGGTGIIGVITGFASVCLAGQEVALPPDVRVAIDQSPASTDILRAGQVAVIDAATAPAGLRARQIVIRYEVVGLVDRIGDNLLRIAGQDVALSPQTWGVRPGRGDFVAVSGLRRGDGTIEATRVDRVPPGPVLVHGLLLEEAGGLRIGALPIRREPDTVPLIGTDVTVIGMIGPDGEMLPFSVAPDLLYIDPAAYFGPQIGVVFIEGFAVLDGGRLRLAPGFRLDHPQRGIFRFDRVDGALRATGFGGPPGGLAAPSRFQPAPHFDPAPVPNRTIRGPANARPYGGGPGGTRGQRGGYALDRNGNDQGFTPSGNAPSGLNPSGFGPPVEGGFRGR